MGKLFISTAKFFNLEQFALSGGVYFNILTQMRYNSVNHRILYPSHRHAEIMSASLCIIQTLLLEWWALWEMIVSKSDSLIMLKSNS